MRKTTKFLVKVVSAWSRLELDTYRIEVGPFKVHMIINATFVYYRGAGKSLARPGRKQARNMSRARAISTTSDASCHQVFFFFLQGKAPKEIHAVLTETLACVPPGRAKGLSAPLYMEVGQKGT